MIVDMPLILASQSPRRKEILSQAGIKFFSVPANIDESPHPDEPADRHTLRMATEKARAIALNLCQTDTTILAADTVVLLNGEILGKPLNDNDAKNMLKKLSGLTHEVLTGWLIMDERGRILAQGVETSRVSFRVISEKEIGDYVSTGEPRDKAGAYAIQGRGGQFVEKVDGLVSNVIGLPIEVILPHLNIAKPRSDQV